MRSPFPGLDPYLETFWGNVHTSMMTYIRDRIQERLPAGLWARVEESVTVDDAEADGPRQVYPDVHVTDERSLAPVWSETVGGLAVAEPVVIVADELPAARHIEIVDTGSGGRVVTAIEVLSPSNKVGEEQRAAFRRKQHEFIRAGVNLVEIDLIRTGGYNLSAPYGHLPEKTRDGSHIVVYRAVRLREWEVYPLCLREPLPAFRIPLRRQDADIALDLQAIMDECYENGRYQLGIDYTKPPNPGLREETDRAWAEALLASRRG